MGEPVGEPQDEVFSRLEQEYAETKLITIISKGDGTPRVQWDATLTENDVIANLVKALLFMTLDEYVSEIFDEVLELGDEEETGEQGP